MSCPACNEITVPTITGVQGLPGADGAAGVNGTNGTNGVIILHSDLTDTAGTGNGSYNNLKTFQIDLGTLADDDILEIEGAVSVLGSDVARIEPFVIRVSLFGVTFFDVPFFVANSPSAPDVIIKIRASRKSNTVVYVHGTWAYGFLTGTLGDWQSSTGLDLDATNYSITFQEKSQTAQHQVTQRSLQILHIPA